MQIQKTTAFNPQASARITEQMRSAAVKNRPGRKEEITPVHPIKNADKEQSNAQSYPSKRADAPRHTASDTLMTTAYSNKILNSQLNSKSKYALNEYLNHQDMPLHEERKQLQRLLGVDDYI